MSLTWNSRTGFPRAGAGPADSTLTFGYMGKTVELSRGQAPVFSHCACGLRKMAATTSAATEDQEVIMPAQRSRHSFWMCTSQ